jgi:hypothetical protein
MDSRGEAAAEPGSCVAEPFIGASPHLARFSHTPWVWSRSGHQVRVRDGKGVR